MEGEGERKGVNGDFYRGRWREGKMVGFGEYEVDGLKYEGNFR